MKKEGLTKREIEVLKLVASGYSDKGIADILFITDATVRTHMANIYRKLGIEENKEYNQRVLLVHNILEKLRGKNENIKSI